MIIEVIMEKANGDLYPNSINFPEGYTWVQCPMTEVEEGDLFYDLETKEWNSPAPGEVGLRVCGFQAVARKVKR